MMLRGDERYDAAGRLAFGMLRADPDRQKTQSTLREWTENRCSPPLSGNDLEILVEEAWRMIQREVSGLPERASGDLGLPLIRAADIESEPVSWIWPGHLAAGVMHVLDGVPGVGKSMLTAYVAATISAGGYWPDGTRSEAADVVLVNLEDDLSRTIVPRLKSAHADLGRVHLLDDSQGGFALSRDLEALERTIIEMKAGLVVIDPLMAVLEGKTNSYRDQDMRSVLAPVKALCGRTGAAVLMVRHLTKAVGGPAIHRGGGSIGIIGAARIGMLLAKHPEDEDRRVLACVKNNLGPTDGESTTWSIEPGPRLEYIGKDALSADALLEALDEQTKAPKGRPAEHRADAAEWLQEALAAGPMPSSELQAKAEADGIAWRTVNRVKLEAGAESYRNGQAWFYRLKVKDQSKNAKNRPYKEFWHSCPEIEHKDTESLRFQECQKSPEVQECQKSEAEIFQAEVEI